MTNKKLSIQNSTNPYPYTVHGCDCSNVFLKAGSTQQVNSETLKNVNPSSLKMCKMEKAK